jgi:Tfp pilus assembly protein PilF
VSGTRSKEASKMRIEVGKIYFEEKNYPAAIQELDVAIGTRERM